MTKEILQLLKELQIGLTSLDNKILDAISDKSLLPFGGKHAPDCPYNHGGECLCWRSDPEQNPDLEDDDFEDEPGGYHVTLTQDFSESEKGNVLLTHTEDSDFNAWIRLEDQIWLAISWRPGNYPSLTVQTERTNDAGLFNHLVNTFNNGLWEIQKLNLSEEFTVELLKERWAKHPDNQEELDDREWHNFYKCPECGHEWDDNWSAQVDDTCPECGLRAISPFKSEENT